MKTKNNLRNTVFTPCIQFVCLISLFATVVSIVASRFFHVTQADLGKMIFWNVEYFFVLALYLELCGAAKLLKEKNLLLITGLYTVSFAMVWVSCDYYLLNFWMLGVLLIATFLPSHIGIAFHIILTISYCMVNSLSVEEFICYFTFGALILILTQFLDTLFGMIMILIISVTTNLAFLILLADFELVISREVIIQLTSTAAMVVVIWIVKRLYGAHYEKGLVLKEDAMRQLKNVRPNIYVHSLEIGNLSAGAAKLIGANEAVSFAGGCYHEIGRIRKKQKKQEGRDYIDDGVEILKKHGVGQDIIAVVKEHNIHYDAPTSKEAAIVMLSDSILSSLKYLYEHKAAEDIQVEEVVSSIINRRFEKGILNQSGLTIEELVVLNEYYVKRMKECQIPRSQ